MRRTIEPCQRRPPFSVGTASASRDRTLVVGNGTIGRRGDDPSRPRWCPSLAPDPDFRDLTVATHASSCGHHPAATGGRATPASRTPYKSANREPPTPTSAGTTDIPGRPARRNAW